MSTSQQPMLGMDGGGAPEAKVGAPVVPLRRVLTDYARHLEGMDAACGMILSLAPALKSGMLTQFLEGHTRKLGKLVSEHGAPEVFEMPDHAWPSVWKDIQSARAFGVFADSIPGMMLVGLVSIYDGFLGQLFETLISAHPDQLSTSDKPITYGELMQLGSLEAAREHVLAKETEKLLRESHAKQFKILEDRFKIELKKNLECWSRFIEICERRNLWTHNGGRATQDYIDKCTRDGGQRPNCKVGDLLEIDEKYLVEAIEVFYEIGVKLCYTLWRKCMPGETEQADSTLNDAGYRLVQLRKYELADKLLAYGTSMKRSPEKVRRMMVINRANALKLQGQRVGALRILDREDWSAAGLMFQVSVAAVKDDVELAVRTMRIIGKLGEVKKSDYAIWPVFVTMRREPVFRLAFFEIFGEHLEELEMADPELAPDKAKLNAQG